MGGPSTLKPSSLIPETLKPPHGGEWQVGRHAHRGGASAGCGGRGVWVCVGGGGGSCCVGMCMGWVVAGALKQVVDACVCVCVRVRVCACVVDW